MTLPRFGDREDAKTPCLIDAYRTARDVSSTVADLSPATLRFGIMPVAHGGQGRIDGTLFEVVMRGVGHELLQQGLVELDLDALPGDERVAAFEQLRQMVDWMDPAFPGRGWRGAAADDGERGGRILPPR